MDWKIFMLYSHGGCCDPFDISCTCVHVVAHAMHGTMPAAECFSDPYNSRPAFYKPRDLPRKNGELRPNPAHVRGERSVFPLDEVEVGCRTSPAAQG
jgi:hypothetical protein